MKTSTEKRSRKNKARNERTGGQQFLGPFGCASESAVPLPDCLGHRGDGGFLLQGGAVRPAVCPVARQFHLVSADGLALCPNRLAIALPQQFSGIVHQHGVGGAVHDAHQSGALGGTCGGFALPHRATLRLRRASTLRQGETPCRTYINMGDATLRPWRVDELFRHFPVFVPFPQQLSGVRGGEKPDFALVLHLHATDAQPLDGHFVRDSHRQLSFEN